MGRPTMKTLKVFAKIVAALFTALFLLLLFTGVLSDIYLMLSVPDSETASIFSDQMDYENINLWDTDQK